MNQKDLRKLREKVKEVQDEKRFEHTQGVEFTAAALAMRYGADVQSAQIAGILHDCAKCLSDKKKVNICKKHQIEITDIEEKNPFLLHAKAGAYLAEHEYGIEDRDILNAIEFHTTGRANMSLLEKIVFIADYIEPGRTKAQNLDEIRKIAFENIDLGMVVILKNTLQYLKGTGEEIDPSTENTLQYYEELIKKSINK